MDIRRGQAWKGRLWANVSRKTSTYDARDHILSESHSIADSNGWDNSLRQMFAYDGAGNEVSGAGDEWESGQWVTQGRWTSTYDVNIKLLSQLQESLENGQYATVARDSGRFRGCGFNQAFKIACLFVLDPRRIFGGSPLRGEYAIDDYYGPASEEYSCDYSPISANITSILIFGAVKIVELARDVIRLSCL